MKPRAIQSLDDFDAAPAPPEGGAFISYPLDPVVPANHKLSGHVCVAYPLDMPASHCVAALEPSHVVAVEVRKYHSKVEVEYRRLTPVAPHKEAA